MSVRIDDSRTGLREIVFQREPANVLSLPLIDALAEAVRSTPEDRAVLLLRSEGKHFSAGVDVAIHAPDRAPAMLENFHGLVAELLDSPAIPVAAVQGVALGGACELLLACDLVVACERAELGLPEIGVGCFPPVAAAWLPDRLGPQLASDMVYSGRRLSAQRAELAGLVSRVASEGTLHAEVERLLAELLGRSRAVLRVARRAMAAPRREAHLARLADCERIYREELLRTHDVGEGVRAFEQKRAPSWRHR